MKMLAKLILKLHTIFPTKIPVMSCDGCLKDDCINRAYERNEICKGYSKGFLFFGDRKKLEEEYYKWLRENKGVADVPFNLITFLDSKNLLDYKRVKKYLKDNNEFKFKKIV